MRDRLVNMLLAAILCIGALPGGLWAQDDANIARDPNTHLVPHLEGMTRARSFLYRRGSEPPWVLDDRITMRLCGRIEVIDANGLLGLSPETIDARILDELGDPVRTETIWLDTVLYEPLRYARHWDATGEMSWKVTPHEFSVQASTSAETAYPSVFSRVEWSMYALLSHTVAVIDLPFAPSEDWVELAPGLEILVGETATEEDRYEYRRQVIFDPNRISYPRRRRPTMPQGEGLDGYTWPARGMPTAILLEIDVLNASGVSLQNHTDDGDTLLVITGGTDFEEGRAEQTIVGLGPGCDEAAFIRCVIASEPYRQEVRLVLEDIPVPSL